MKEEEERLKLDKEKKIKYGSYVKYLLFYKMKNKDCNCINVFANCNN